MFVINSGNLAQPVVMSVDEQGRVRASAMVICEQGVKDEFGEWQTIDKQVFYVHASGRTAENLYHTQKVAGNRAIVFAGTVRASRWQDDDGAVRVSRHVQATHVGVDLARGAYQRTAQPAPRFVNSEGVDAGMPLAAGAPWEPDEFEPEDLDTASAGGWQ